MSVFRIFSQDVLIGESELEHCDQAMSVYSGGFRVSPEYVRVRPVFKLFSAAMDLKSKDQEVALAQYYRQRDDLFLTMRTQNDELVSTNLIHILDLEEDMDGLQVEVSLNSPIGEAIAE